VANDVLGALYASVGDADSATYYLSLAESWKRQAEVPLRRVAANLKASELGAGPTIPAVGSRRVLLRGIPWVEVLLMAAFVFVVGYCSYRFGVVRSKRDSGNVS